jgi:hypothetical protein
MTFDNFNCWLRGWVHTLLDWECLRSFFVGPAYRFTGHIYEEDKCIDCGHVLENIPSVTVCEYRTGTGQKLYVHQEGDYCQKLGCCIHAPSDHPLRAHPTNWRKDRCMMERICDHGIGHPDPDHIAYVMRTQGECDSVHGCDGCCCTGENIHV